MKRLILIASLASPIFAQQTGVTYTKVYEVTVSAAAAVSTLQQPSSPTKTAHLLGLQIYCSVACTATFEAAGAASTGTQSSGVPTSPSRTETSTIVHYAASNAAAATNPINKFKIAAGSEYPIGFTEGTDGIRSNAILARTAGQNFTVRTDAITGDVKITWFWREE